MIKNQAAYIAAKFLDVAGVPVVGVVPTVTLSPDAAGYGASTNAASSTDANGNSKILLTAAETNVDSLQIDWQAAGAVGVLQTDPGLVDYTAIAALILATPANLLATDGAGAVTTDAASRTASQADVSGLSTQAELDKVIKSGDISTWSSSLGTKNDVTVTRNP